MDTRFWGPSGWTFLHQITFSYEPSQRKVVESLFRTLPFVLPCKFCRASLTEYMEKEPLDISSQDALSRWLWKIHNLVNHKLRSQGETKDPDPSFESVKKFYEESLQSGCTRTEFPGWIFLFSIAENHPLSRYSRNTVPMSDAPTRSSGLTKDELNRWNLFRPEERMPFYREFFLSIGDSLPFPEWRELWLQLSKKTGLKGAIHSRAALIRSMYSMRCEMERKLELVNRTKFADLCTVLANHRSGCSKSKRARTCRKTRKLGSK
jgi:hypothetical protein